MRDAPSISVVQTLLDAGAQIAAYDPEGMNMASSLMPDVTMTASPYEAVNGADAIVIVTEWDAFRALDLAKLAELARGNVLVDLRNIYRGREVERHGLVYHGIGMATD